MKYLIYTAVLLMFFSFRDDDSPKTIDNKGNERKFSQFIVEDADTREEAQMIDKHMRAQAGVFMSRMDNNSRKYLILHNSHYSYDQAYFIETFEKLGFEIKCYREGIYGVDKIIDQKLDCE